MLNLLREQWTEKKSGARFRDAYFWMSEQGPWKALQNDDERDLVFQDFMEGFEAENKDDRKSLRKVKIEELKKSR